MEQVSQLPRKPVYSSWVPPMLWAPIRAITSDWSMSNSVEKKLYISVLVRLTGGMPSNPLLSQLLDLQS